VKTSRDGGRWSFSPSQLIDDIAQSKAAEVVISLRFADTTFPCVRVISKFEVTGLMCVANHFDPESGATSFEFSWSENKAFSDRLFRVWSLSRPWEPPLQIEIPPGGGSSLTFQVKNELPFGECLAEVDLRDEWRRVARPSLNASNVRRFRYGSEAQRKLRIESLDPTDVSNAIELSLQTRIDALSDIAEPDLLEHAGRLASAFELCVSDTRGRVDPSLGTLLVLLTASGRRSEIFAAILQEFQILFPHRLAEFVLNVLPYMGKVSTVDYTNEVRDLLWSISEELGATLDALTTGPNSNPNLWMRFTGWPKENTEITDLNVGSVDRWVPEFRGFIDRELSQKSAEVLRGLIPFLGEISISDQKPLAWGGFFDAALELFEVSERDPVWLERINADARNFGRHIEGSPSGTLYFFRQLEPERESRPLARTPQALLALAIHVVRRGRDATRAVSLLTEAQTKTPLLVRRSILLAAALTLLEGTSSHEPN
jgi:hypothetical protein